MKTVLFAWELGAGLGHAAPLIAIADALLRRNAAIRPVFAFRDTIYTRRLPARPDWPIMPTPVLPVSDEGRSSEASYAQILLGAGFNRPPDLAAMVKSWDDIFAVVKPDLVVAEHSPFACLAARGRYPLLVTGTSFTVPPADTNIFPPFRRGIEPPAVQARMVAAINAILDERGQEPLSCLPELLAGDARAVFGLPHLDPYGPLRKDRLLGPYHGRMPPQPVPEDRSIFFYSRAEEERLDDMVDVLLDLGDPISAFITGADSVARTLLKNRGATIYDDPPDLQDVLGPARLVISHGGAGVTNAALMLGRAQLIVPIHVESDVTAIRVETIGSSMTLKPFDKDAFREAIDIMQTVRLFHERAQEAAGEIAALDLPSDPVGEVAATAERLLGIA